MTRTPAVQDPLRSGPRTAIHAPIAEGELLSLVGFQWITQAARANTHDQIQMATFLVAGTWPMRNVDFWSARLLLLLRESIGTETKRSL